VELKAVAEKHYTAGPLKVELVVANGRVVFGTKSVSGGRSSRKTTPATSLQPLDPNSLINHMLKHSPDSQSGFASQPVILGLTQVEISVG